MSEKILIRLNGRQEAATAGLTLSEIIKGERPCGGHGRCGKCRVVARGALSPLTDAEKEAALARIGERIADVDVSDLAAERYNEGVVL